jgi:hypothetical protein
MLSKNIKIRIHKTVILPVVLYGCETCSLTLREEHRLRVFENRLLTPLGRPRRRGVDNIKIDLREIVWIGLIWLRIGTNGGLL